MRTEAEIVADLVAARDAYREVALVENAAQLAARSAVIKALLDEQDALLCAGAKPCPACGAEPYGRLKTPAHKSKGASVAAVYAIQCNTVACQEAGKLSVGQTPKVAVFAWNEGIYAPKKGA